MLPRDRVDDARAELGGALEAHVVADADRARHVDEDAGRVAVLAAAECRPDVVLVAHADAEAVVDVRVDLDCVALFEVEYAATVFGVADDVAEYLVHFTLVDEVVERLEQAFCIITGVLD